MGTAINVTAKDLIDKFFAGTLIPELELAIDGYLIDRDIYYMDGTSSVNETEEACRMVIRQFTSKELHRINMDRTAVKRIAETDLRVQLPGDLTENIDAIDPERTELKISNVEHVVFEVLEKKTLGTTILFWVVVARKK